jgi:excinuclease ABC subunit B
MQRALAETSRRRKKQRAYNEERGLEPKKIKKGLSRHQDLLGQSVDAPPGTGDEERLAHLEEEMERASEELRFEDAAALRDEIKELGAILSEE